LLIALFGGILGQTVLEEHPMSVLVQSHGGYARCEATRLVLSLDSRLFAPHLWTRVQEWFRGGRHSAWLRQPFQVMTAAPTTSGPRWKEVAVDVLSWLIFLVMVPADHPLVALWQVVDWAAINRLCAPCYQNDRRGQRAWAPAQMVALLVLFLALPAPSESALLRTVAIVPLYRWFCGFGLFSALPDHSSLYTFRQRVGAEGFEAILTGVIGQCMERGLIDNRLAFFDMMGVPASAHDWTPYERAVLLTYALGRYLEQAGQESMPEALRQVTAEVAVAVLDNKQLRKDAGIGRRVLQSMERWTRLRREAPGVALWERILEEAVQELRAEADAPALPPADPATARDWLKELAKRLKERLPHTRGDRDARMGHTSPAKLCCGYWLGFLVDSRRSVITAVRVLPLIGNQHGEMVPALDAHQARTGHYPQAVSADSAQDYDWVHVALAWRQIQGHIAARLHPSTGTGLGPEHFLFNEQGQVLCPAGKVMTRHGRRKKGRWYFKAHDCRACPRREVCVPQGQRSRRVRAIYLEVGAHRRWQQNRANTRTAAYKAARAQRFASEGLFGLARRLYGAEKMPYRSLPMNTIAGLLIGTVLNLAVLARQG
jgi:transposase